MLDRYVAPITQAIYDPPGKMLVEKGVSGDIVSLVGFAFGVGAAVAVGLGYTQAAIALLLLNRIIDGMDSAMARAGGMSDFGRYLDITLDFLFYAAFALAFAFASTANALVAAILIFSLLGLGGTVLAYAVIAAGRGMAADATGNLWVDILSELVETSETTLALILLALLPNYFGAIALLFAFFCLVTTIFRVVRAWIAFR